jgi:hypothetical protein
MDAATSTSWQRAGNFLNYDKGGEVLMNRGQK